jgi:hypothetical protein
MNKIDIIKALLSDEINTGSPIESETFNQGSKIKIVILQRGWVFVGYMKQAGSRCTLTKAKNIRTWGTTKGLGEIAEGGPTSLTRLDDINDVTFHELTVIATIDCNESKWSKEL